MTTSPIPDPPWWSSLVCQHHALFVDFTECVNVNVRTFLPQQSHTPWQNWNTFQEGVKPKSPSHPSTLPQLRSTSMTYTTSAWTDARIIARGLTTRHICLYIHGATWYCVVATIHEVMKPSQRPIVTLHRVWKNQCNLFLFASQSVKNCEDDAVINTSRS